VIANLPFWIAAIFGTTIIAIQLMLMMLGLNTADGADVYHDVDTAEGTEDAFKVLSLQTIAAFFMAFGWGGLAAIEQLELSTTLGTVIAITLGLIFVYIIKSIFSLAMSLSSPGVDYDLKDLIGKKTNVYERIPAGGTGVIQVFLADMLRDVQARSDSTIELSTGTQVEIIEVINSTTVKVK